MKRILRFPVILAAAAFLYAVPAFSDEIIGLPANSANCIPFGLPFAPEYQQVYTASAFSGPITINALDFYNTYYNSGATSMASGNWAISLSTTSADWNTLSTNEAANIGANNSLVFSGNLAQPWSFGNTLHIAFSTPFVYNPGAGNLLMDVVTSGITQPGGTIFFDASFNTAYGRDWGNGVDNGYGLVTGFVTAPVASVPEPHVYVLLVVGLGLMGLFARLKGFTLA